MMFFPAGSDPSINTSELPNPRRGIGMDPIYLAVSSVASFALALSIASWRRDDAIRREIRALSKLIMKVSSSQREHDCKCDCIKYDAVLALAEAARLLAEDAEKVYKETGDELMLKIAKKWRRFLEVNKEAIERAMGKVVEG